MKACPFCAEDVGEGTVTCPHCGSAIQTLPGTRPGKSNTKIWLVVIGIVVGVTLLVACCGLGVPMLAALRWNSISSTSKADTGVAATPVAPAAATGHAAPVPVPLPEPKCEGEWAYYTLITGGGGMERSNLFTTAAECDRDHASTAVTFRQMGLGTVSDCKCTKSAASSVVREAAEPANSDATPPTLHGGSFQITTEVCGDKTKLSVTPQGPNAMLPGAIALAPGSFAGLTSATAFAASDLSRFGWVVRRTDPQMYWILPQGKSTPDEMLIWIKWAVLPCTHDNNASMFARRGRGDDLSVEMPLKGASMLGLVVGTSTLEQARARFPDAAVSERELAAGSIMQVEGVDVVFDGQGLLWSFDFDLNGKHR